MAFDKTPSLTPRRREQDPSTDAEETKFHEQVRDILGMSPFDRHEQIYVELRRLKAIEALSANWL